MDWNLLGLSFVMVFLSELGDKSQLAAISLGSQCQSPRLVFLGVALALVLTSLLGVLAGEGVAQLLPTHLLKGIAAIGFAVMGLTMLWTEESELE